ncbi:RxLR effector protein [Phytophthora megakarya]|uniref:RxLR effector protein n=1 Tax=Phytophthora megakarya TaxID=4795 RepID=A0A225VTB2_9STRA|nr:RxLR effector protein [Phytophthora megakarya]
MRAIYVVLIAVAAFLASSDAHVLTTDADQNQLSQSVAMEKRFLRINKVDDDEERGYSNIFGIKRNFAETIDCLTDWVNKGSTIQHVANQMKVKEFNTQDENWNALIQFVIMKHWNVKGERLTSDQVNAILRTIL